MKISCLFPMYNEERNIRTVISDAVLVLSNIVDELEIIIVNDGSFDQTSIIAENMAKSDRRIKVVNHKKNRGYGAALRSGFKACNYEAIFQSDGDNQFDLREIPRLLHYFNDYDFVVGYRIKRKDPFGRVIIAGFYRILLNILFNIKLKDANCAFKLFRKSILDQLDLESDGAIINSEIFIKARRQGYSNIKETGVNHRPRKFGAQTGASPSVLVEALISIACLFWEDLRVRHLPEVKRTKKNP